MLKKKIKELRSLEQSQGEKKFEVIHDAMAVQVTGGNQPCGVLESCGTYTGSNCPSLKTCTTYSETT